MTTTGKTTSTKRPARTPIELHVEGLGIVRPAGINAVVAKGKRYFYHRASKTRIEGITEAADGRLVATKDVLAIIEQLSRPEAAPIPGTVGALFVAWRASADFQGNAYRTRCDYEDVMEWIAPAKLAPGQKPRWRDKPIRWVTPGRIFALMEKAHEKKKRRFANYVRSVLGSAYRWAYLQDWVEIIPTRDVPTYKRPSDTQDVNLPWTPAERIAFWKRIEGKPHLRLPHMIGVLVGLREIDVVNLPLTAWDGELLHWKTSKSGVRQSVRPAPVLKAELDAAIARRSAAGGNVLPMFLCLNSRGLKWTVDGFRASYFKELAKAQAAGELGAHKGFHSHRHGIGNTLAAAKVGHAGIKAALANKTAASVEHYIAHANSVELAATSTAIIDDAIASEFEA